MSELRCKKNQSEISGSKLIEEGNRQTGHHGFQTGLKYAAQDTVNDVWQIIGANVPKVQLKDAFDFMPIKIIFIILLRTFYNISLCRRSVSRRLEIICRETKKLNE